MILVVPAVSALHGQISGCEEPMTIYPPNMQRLPLTVSQRLTTKARFRSVAIQIASKQVTNYSDKDEDVIVIASSKVQEHFKRVKEFPNLFLKTMPTELPPLREVNHGVNPKPKLVCLPTWRPSANKFGQQINNKFNAEVE